MADTNQTKIRYARETAWGETPSGPAATELRITSESFAHNKGTLLSEEITSDRNRTALLEVDQSAEGEFGYELAHGSLEPFFETALRGTIASATVAVASCTVAASSITAPAGTDFVAAFSAGQFVKVGGRNDVVQITSLSSTVLTTTGSTMVASVISASITGRTLTNGTTKTSYFIEGDFEDITAVKYLTGMRVDGMSMSAQSQQIVTGVFSFMGKRGFAASTSVASTTTSATLTTPMTGAVNVTDIYEGGTKLSDAVQGIDINLANNMRIRPQIGSKTTAEPGDGGIDVTGNVNMYFDNITMYEKFINHTASSLAMKFKDSDGNYIVVSMPEVFYSSGNPGASGQDADVFISLDYTAIKDSTYGYTMRMDFLPA